MDLNVITEFLSTRGIDMAINLVSAILIWVVGRWVINKIMTLFSMTMDKSGKLDKTLARYVISILSAVMTVFLVMFILGRFGIETTSFAALLAGAGLAIGTAWGGLLAHFAAGVFMQILRPFKVGDYVNAGDVEGTVTEISLFTSTILTIENVTTIVGNNKIFSDNIQNFSAQPYRRVDCAVTFYHDVNVNEVLSTLRADIANIPNVVQTPAPEIEVLSITEAGPEICVRPFCHNDHYWPVLYATNKAITDAKAANNWPAPATHEVEWQINDNNKRS